MSKERPILFSTEMVRAILDGRKTMTRRVVKPQPPSTYIDYNFDTPYSVRWENINAGNGFDSRGNALGMHTVRCPYGQPGDLLWVRETYQQVWRDMSNMENDDSSKIPNWDERTKTPAWGTGENYWIYRADGEVPKHPKNGKFNWKPSIHMPRAAARIILRITDVKVERLQDISPEEVEKEGVQIHIPVPGDGEPMPKFQFKKLWNSINGPSSWESNPWVWVISFERA